MRFLVSGGGGGLRVVGGWCLCFQVGGDGRSSGGEPFRRGKTFFSREREGGEREGEGINCSNYVFCV